MRELERADDQRGGAAVPGGLGAPMFDGIAPAFDCEAPVFDWKEPVLCKEESPRRWAAFGEPAIVLVVESARIAMMRAG